MIATQRQDKPSLTGVLKHRVGQQFVGRTDRRRVSQVRAVVVPVQCGNGLPKGEVADVLDTPAFRGNALERTRVANRLWPEFHALPHTRTNRYHTGTHMGGRTFVLGQQDARPAAARD